MHSFKYVEWNSTLPNATRTFLRSKVSVVIGFA